MIPKWQKENRDPSVELSTVPALSPFVSDTGAVDPQRVISLVHRTPVKLVFVQALTECLDSPPLALPSLSVHTLVLTLLSSLVSTLSNVVAEMNKFVFDFQSCRIK